MMQEATESAAEMDAGGDLSPRSRLALFHGSSTSVAEALQIDLSTMSTADLRARGVTADNLRATGVNPALLSKIGVRTVEDLRDTGLDALDLCEVGFCSQCVAQHGAHDVRRAFLVNASDAVALAGTQAAQMLAITPSHLLEVSAGDPRAAKTVLQQLGSHALKNVSLETLMDTGIQLPALTECGYGFAYVMKLYSPTPKQAALLGMQPMLKK
jgi:hypothetical protein